MITAELTVARLIEEHPGLLEALVGLHPRLVRLRNPLLQSLTLSQVADIARMPVGEVVERLRRQLGEPSVPLRASPVVRDAVSGRPAALAAVPDSRRVELDVRGAIDRGEEPLPAIMRTVARLGSDQVLVLRAPFEPVPLYDVLRRRGLLHWAERRAADDWTVWFYRAAPARTDAPGSSGDAADTATLTLDVRGLEAPQPMVRVLEHLDRLAPGQRLVVLHERRPLFLYPQIEERGFTHETDEPAPGLVRIVVTRGA